jgi:hypothetical protein
MEDREKETALLGVMEKASANARAAEKTARDNFMAKKEKKKSSKQVKFVVMWYGVHNKIGTIEVYRRDLVGVVADDVRHVWCRVRPSPSAAPKEGK